MVISYFPSPPFLPSRPFPCTSSEGQPHAGPVQVTGLKIAKVAKKGDKLCKLNQLSERPDEHQSWPKERRGAAWLRKEQGKRRRTSLLAAVRLPQLHPQRKELKKGQSKQTSGKLLKVVVGTCWQGKTAMAGWRWPVVIHPDSPLGCRKSCWTQQPQREPGGGGEGERRKQEGLLLQHRFWTISHILW